MSTSAKQVSLFDASIVKPALVDSLRKLDPRALARNPVMFVVGVGSVLTTALLARDLVVHASSHAPLWFSATPAPQAPAWMGTCGSEPKISRPRPTMIMMMTTVENR